ncbi:sensor domain-containing phosphodiesterase [Rheinheimera nanhaiensis]|uniref:Intracellular signaling protein n=1 Tax=Rheinheimera nanhaiensis E407-8 TaxID=562729 RepID=I1E2U8_9GAMM|nr:diguanylate cyclase [Rheinheimera nanhaiensis]GAB60626.1 intracellular signaling protein [Rheinheimera nanhaiensis E407-8]
MKGSTESAKRLKQAQTKLRRLDILARRYKQAYITQGALLKLSELASTISDMREFYPAIHKMVSELLHAENFYVVFYDNQTDHYTPQYFSDEKDQQLIADVPSSAFSSGLTGYVARSGQPLLCDTEQFEQLICSGAIEPQGSPCAHWLGIPLCRGEQVIGVMAIQSYNAKQLYTESDLALFSSIGGHTITALDRVKSRELLEETVRLRTRELRQINSSLQKEITERINAEKLQAALYRISELTASSRDMNGFYRAVHQVLGELMAADNCYIALLDAERSKLTFPFYLDQYSPPARERPLSRGFTEYVIRCADAKLINTDIADKLVAAGEIRRGMADPLKAARYSTSWLGAPLLIEQQVIGVIALQSYDDRYHYSDNELNILRFVSQHIAVAIQRKLATEQQKQHQEELERKVFESTRELRQTNLFLRLQVEERKKAEQKLFYEANHDALTGLANRQMFLQQLKQQFALSKRQPQQGLALLFIDLDRFKQINDSLGHHVGDAFLVEVSKRLLSTVREHDMVARLGGDEFVVLLTSLPDAEDAEDIAERIIEKIRQPFYLQGQQVHSGASIGIAHFDAEHSKPEAMLRDADAAMYQAKSMGRNRFVIFNDTMREQLLQAMTLEQVMQQALAQQQFTAVYEPVLCGQGRTLLGYEVHSQWQHPLLGTQYDFSQFSADAAMTVQIEQLILQQACRQLAASTDDSGLLSLRLSVAHLQQHELLQQLKQQLSVLPQPQRLCLAFTERELLQAGNSIHNVLHQLKQNGIRLAIHQFAADSAPMGLLLLQLFEFVKLDASFCRQLPRQAHKRQLLQMLQQLAHNYKFRLLADGVDNAELLNLLLDEGCCFMQGKYVTELLSAKVLAETPSVIFQQLA